jgi:hypothetical protein
VRVPCERVLCVCAHAWVYLILRWLFGLPSSFRKPKQTLWKRWPTSEASKPTEVCLSQEARNWEKYASRSFLRNYILRHREVNALNCFGSFVRNPRLLRFQTEQPVAFCSLRSRRQEPQLRTMPGWAQEVESPGRVPGASAGWLGGRSGAGAVLVEARRQVACRHQVEQRSRSRQVSRARFFLLCSYREK